MSSGGSARAVVAALGANVAITVSKLVAFAFSGSSSMLAEGIHSLADSGNQVLLLIGGRKSQREASEQHPFGYGRERYVFGFLVAVVLFSLGGLFAVYEGYEKIKSPHPLDNVAWPLGVLAFALVAESFSFRTAIAEARRVRGRETWVGFIRHAKAPELPVVLLEDFGALIGLVLALCGVVLTAATHDGGWDGVATLAIGVLLGGAALVLGSETKSLLLGEGASSAQVSRIRAALVDGQVVTSVIHMRTMHLGPEELLVAAKIGVEHDDTAAQVAHAIDAAEARVRAAVPIAAVIYLEPDIRRAAGALEPTPSTDADKPAEQAKPADSDSRANEASQHP
jgi:cation diffusion facilitator family transporter